MSPKTDNLIPKEQAAAFLGKSPRMLDIYRSKGRIAATYIKNAAGRDEAFYDRSDLETLKSDLQASVTGVGGELITSPQALKPAIASRFTLDDSQALAFITEIHEIRVAMKTPQPVPLTDLNVKPILSVDEIRRLTGIPRDRIMSAIKDGTLQGSRNLGRGWRVKRFHLDQWVAGL